MENESTQTQKKLKEKDRGSAKSSMTSQNPGTTVPLVITIIGIFCYIGVILPSVFESSAEVIDYTTYDLLLMIGGAALVGIGAYFWFKVKNKIRSDDENKTIETA
jgi:hypothetical protein